jgi:hypothetical protein
MRKKVEIEFEKERLEESPTSVVHSPAQAWSDECRKMIGRRKA